MRKSKKISFFLTVIVVVLAAFFAQHFVFSSSNKSSDKNNATKPEVVNQEPKEKILKIEITDGSTYGKLMEKAGIDTNQAMALFEAAKDIYDLSKIRVGRTLDLYFNTSTQEFEKLVYQIDTEEELQVNHILATSTATSTVGQMKIWQAEVVPINYDIKIKTAGGTIKSSMYETALEEGIDERAIIELANAFQWSVDFAMDVRKGDTFKFIYEERYRDGKYVMPGRILAGKFVNAGKPYYIFYFEESDDNKGYFDENGNSVQKMFLKAPVAYKYISSGYTSGPRYVSAFKRFTSSHRAIDYAASYGAPVRAVGNGTVVRASWNGPYGNFISIRHNSTYTTNYAHLSGYAVRVGQKVKQGDVIGYVGSTGFSTGPHVHFEMVKNGVKINPLQEILPPGKPIKEESKERFFSEISKYKDKLDK